MAHDRQIMRKARRVLAMHDGAVLEEGALRQVPDEDYEDARVERSA